MNKKKNPNPIFDLRAHRATYISQGSNQVPSRKSVFWFWNSDHSPAPGMAIVGYLGPSYESRPHGNAKRFLVPYNRSSHESISSYGKRHHESTWNVYKEEMFRAEDLNSTTPRSRQQVANAKHRERKACGIVGVASTSGNFATVFT